MMKPRSILTAIASIVAVFCVAAGLSGQTLARPGWVGSGLSAQPWFKHAILYEIDTRTFASSKPNASGDATGDIKGITQHLDYIHSLGVDAILLKPLTAAQSGAQGTTIDPALGTLDDFDELMFQASRVKVRVLLELPNPDPALARFWLTRGVAGFHVPVKASENTAGIRAMRKLLLTYVGQRVLISDISFAAVSRASKASPNELLLDRVFLKSSSAGAATFTLRTSLEDSQTLPRIGTPILALDRAVDANAGPSLAKILAAFVLLNRSASLISAGQELDFFPGQGKGELMPWGQPAAAAVEESTETTEPPAPAPVAATPDKYMPYVPYVRPEAPKKPAPPDPATAAGQENDPNSLLNFYRDLASLHHGGTALRDGEEITFNHDDRNALVWMRRPALPSQFKPPIVIACNLSGKPLVISLTADVTRHELRGRSLRTILHSDDVMGDTSLDPITLPPYSVYVGGLR